MKRTIFYTVSFLLITLFGCSDVKQKSENVFIVDEDGYRIIHASNAKDHKHTNTTRTLFEFNSKQVKLTELRKYKYIRFCASCFTADEIASMKEFIQNK